MRNRGESVVDLLEIYHARRLRDQIIAQLKRIASAEVHGFPIDEAVHRKAARYYEAALITVADLLEELGDRRPLD
jgi:hypothetical protein